MSKPNKSCNHERDENGIIEDEQRIKYETFERNIYVESEAYEKTIKIPFNLTNLCKS